MKRILTVLLTLTANTALANNVELMPSKTLIEHIKKAEGLRLCAYKDSNNNAIGYGTQRDETGKLIPLTVGKGKNKKPFCITEQRAEELLLHYVYFKAGQIDAWAKIAKVKLNQNEFDAIVGFTYNLGFGAFKRSSIATNLKLKNKKAAAEAFLEYTKSKGVTLKGLELRRKFEYTLFLKPIKEFKKGKKQ